LIVAGRKITVEFLGKDSSAGSTASKVEQRFGKLGGKLDKVGQAAGKVLAGGLVGGAAAMYKFGQQAGDLAETQSKVNQIFGAEGAAALEKFAGSAAKNLGQSQQTALDAASTFGIFGKAAKLSGSDLVGFSTEMTTLASDLASFNNTSPEQAIEAIGAALRGEAEPIRAYGVMLDEAALKAEALSMGLLKPVKDGAKIKGYQVAILEGQKKYNDAVAEFGPKSLEALRAESNLGTARDRLTKATEGTIPPLTQQQKVLAAQSAIMKQTKVAQGDFARTSDGLANKQRILKAQFADFSTELGARALPYMVKAVDIGLKMIAWVDRNRTTVGALVVGIGSLAAVVYTVSAAMRAWAAITKVWMAVTKIAAAVQWALNAAMLANPVGLVILAIAGLVAGLVIAYKKSETFRKIVNGAFHGVQKAAKFAWDWIKQNWPLILAVITGPIGLAVYAVVKNWDRITAGAKKMKDGVATAFTNVVTFVKGIPGKILSAIGNLGTLLASAGRAAIQGLIDGITEKVGALQDKLTSVTKLIPDWKGPLDKDKILLRPAGIAIMRGLIDGIESQKSKLTTVLSRVTGFIAKMNDKIKDLLSKRSDVVGSFKGFSQSVFGQDLSNQETGAPPSVSALLAYQAEQKAKAQKLRDDVRKLTKMGLSKSLIQQMVSSGESGIAQISALASGSKADVKQLNALNAGTQALLGQAGMSAGNALFGDAIAKARKDKAVAVEIAKELRKLLREQEGKTVVEVILDGRVIHTSLVKLKKSKGANLGLA
jgi:hypothetical protein